MIPGPGVWKRLSSLLPRIMVMKGCHLCCFFSLVLWEDCASVVLCGKPMVKNRWWPRAGEGPDPVDPPPKSAPVTITNKA